MKKLQVLLLMLFGLTFMTSCGSDVDCSDMTALEAELDPLLDTYLDAIIAYNADQSSTNCDALKDSIDKLIDKSRDFEECVPEEDKAEFESDLQAFQDQLDALSC